MTVATLLEASYMYSLGFFDDAPASLKPSLDQFMTIVDRLLEYATPEAEYVQEDTIDDYYSRPHIREPVTLIVGGSDGSGTRAFAQYLQFLDVPMVVDDLGTYDAHAEMLYDGQGWPALVARVLNATRSATYTVDQLSQSLRTEAKKELSIMLDAFRSKLDDQIQKRRSRLGDIPMASSVSMGFKAPISQLLLPLFRDQLPAAKFLHIVRDGRDVALSDNQSPVKKFYSTFYEDAHARDLQMEENNFGFESRMQIKALELWNDWNSQVYDYGKEHADGTTFDVLVMRSEDLLEDTYNSLLKLADFVGSPKTPQELCCLSRRGLGDMGESDVNGRRSLFGPNGVDPTMLASVKNRFQKMSDVAQRNPGRPWLASTANKLHAASAGDGLAQLPEDVSAEGQFVYQGDVLIWNEKGGVKLDQAGHVEDQRQEAIHHRRLMEAVEDNDDKIPIDLTKKIGVPVKSSHSFVNPFLPPENLRHSLYHKPLPLAPLKQNQDIVTESRRQKNKLQASGGALRGPYNRDAEVKKRYGKWVKALESYPELSQIIHTEGAKALHMFGYEPQRCFMDIQKPPFKCNSRVVCEKDSGKYGKKP
jgi:hypothetical protein